MHPKPTYEDLEKRIRELEPAEASLRASEARFRAIVEKSPMGVGNIAIKTENIHLDEIFCKDQEDTAPGDYVLLEVSDDGCGMDMAVIDNLFEPFFTTKELGKGTGLGLATIYGIVRQNSGTIKVISRPGQGTTFDIYIPRDAGTANPVL